MPFENKDNKLSSLFLLSYLEQFKDNKKEFKKQFKRIFGVDTIIPSKKRFKRSEFNWEWLYKNFDEVKSDLIYKADNPQWDSTNLFIIEKLNSIFRKQVVEYIKNNKLANIKFKELFIKFIEPTINLSFEATDTIYDEMDLEKFKSLDQDEKFNLFLQEFQDKNNFFDEIIAQAIANILGIEFTCTSSKIESELIMPVVFKETSKSKPLADIELSSLNEPTILTLNIEKNEETKLNLSLEKGKYKFTIKEHEHKLNKKQLDKLKSKKNKFEVIHVEGISELHDNLEEMIVENAFNKKEAIEALKAGKTLLLVIPTQEKINVQKLQKLLEDKLYFKVTNNSEETLSQDSLSSAESTNETLIPEEETTSKQEDSLTAQKQLMAQFMQQCQQPQEEPAMSDEVKNMYG